MSAGAACFDMHIRVPLDRFQLEIDHTARARVTGLFGKSGSGKTTVLEALAGLRKNVRGYIACGGDVWLDSEQGVCRPPEKRRIGYVPQEHLLFPHLDVKANLLSGSTRAKPQHANFARTFESIVEVLEVGQLLKRRVTSLSGGERQRVALGRALCSGPSLLLLDEPLAALDGALRRRILPFLQRVRDTFDLPIIIVSHNPTELQALCDELLAIRDGKVIARGRPIDVLTRPDLFVEAESQGFQNTLPARLDRHEEHASLVSLGAPANGVQIRIPRCEAAPGEPIFLAVSASEILVSNGRPQGLSARNHIKGRVETVHEVGRLILLTVAIHKSLPPLAVELTADALEELEIQKGGFVYLIIKSSSFTTYCSGGVVPS